MLDTMSLSAALAHSKCTCSVSLGGVDKRRQRRIGGLSVVCLASGQPDFPPLGLGASFPAFDHGIILQHRLVHFPDSALYSHYPRSGA